MMSSTLRAPILAPLILAGALAACSPKPAPASGADKPQSVGVVPVASGVLSATLALPGQLLPYESVDLYPKVTGFIRELPVDRGSVVKAGQVLVRLSAPELGAQKEQLAAALRAAQAKQAQDRATYERLANAAKTPGVVAENDVDVARQLAAADEAQVASVRESMRSAAQQESYLEIRAPFAGVVTARNLHPGALVGPTGGPGAGGAPILSLVKDDRLRLTVAVPEADAQDLKVGQSVSFTTPSAPGRTFQAPVARIARALDARTRSMMVELDVPNAGHEVRAGEFATVQWPVQRSYPTLQVPTSAVANDQQRQFVIRVANGVTSWVDVTTGMTNDGKVEVFGKLAAGDSVVKRATDALASGTHVQPVAAK
ncbi:MAG: efflux RND transporter periplasmic adaptor subunit [Proteobacteria bacterium]|nr:efflux RND transporter periplasmic adaptor subunit [Pseudomonadota bacterium]